MNKLVYFCLSELEIRKILMFQFWYDKKEKKENYVT